MSVILEKYESRPVPVEAILWDGTRKSAKKIIKYLATRGVDGQYNDTTKVVNGETQEDIYISFLNQSAMLYPNYWLVLQEKNHRISGRSELHLFSFNGETFAEAYRLRS